MVRLPLFFIGDVMIPNEMKSERRWVLWRRETRDGEPTKTPICAMSGKYAKSNDLSTWTSYKMAANSRVKHDGLGYVLGDGWVGVDMDGHIDDKCEFSPLALKVINVLKSYTELSPSGRGIHILCRGKLPDKGPYYRKNSKLGLEMYDWHRFFTVTGNVLVAKKPRRCSKSLLRVCREYMRRPKYPVVKIDPDVLRQTDIEGVLKRAEHDPKFRRLYYEGDTSAYAHYDKNGDYNEGRSEADMALISKLHFYTQGDTEQMIGLFRKSALAREKSMRDDYVLMMIERVSGGEVWQPRSQTLLDQLKGLQK